MSQYVLPQQPNGSGGETTVLFNQTVVAMANSSLTASTAIPVTNFNGRGIMAFMNITTLAAGSGSTTYALKIKAVNPLSTGSVVVLGAAAVQSATGVSTLCIYPGIAASAGVNAQVNMVLPRDFQIVASLSSGATSKGVTLSLAYFLMS